MKGTVFGAEAQIKVGLSFFFANGNKLEQSNQVRKGFRTPSDQHLLLSDRNCDSCLNSHSCFLFVSPSPV